MYSHQKNKEDSRLRILNEKKVEGTKKSYITKNVHILIQPTKTTILQAYFHLVISC